MNTDGSLQLAMAAQASVAGLVLVLEDVNLAATSLLDDFAVDGGGLDSWRADSDVAAAVDEQHVVELDRVAGVAVEALEGHDLTGRDSILFAAAANNGVDIGWIGHHALTG